MYLVNFIEISLSEILAISIPAPPVESECPELQVVGPPTRNKSKREKKASLYANLFKRQVHHQGYTAQIIHGQFMVYQGSSSSSTNAYQCEANHENVLRAYTALRLHCADNCAQFITLSRGGINENTIPILPIPPETAAVRDVFPPTVSHL
jgi:hypothetical protein